MSLQPMAHPSKEDGNKRRRKVRHRICIMPSTLLMATSLEDVMLPDMDAREVTDRILAMRKQEITNHHRCVDYLTDDSDSLFSHGQITGNDEESRIKMSAWCYQVVDFCKFRRETVGIAMSYLDRFFTSLGDRNAVTDRKFYQLVAMTSLYIAIKIHEPMEMETSLLADLSRGCYTDLQIAEMELEILEALDWRLAGPTPLGFVQHFIALFSDTVNLRIKAAIMDYARYQTELAVSCAKLVPWQASEIALAALLNAMEGIDRKLLPLRIQGAFLRAVESASGIFVEQVAKAQDCLSKILLDIYPEGSSLSQSSSSSIHWERLSERLMQPSSPKASVAAADTSPNWVGFSRATKI